MFTIIVGTYEKVLYGFEVHPRNKELTSANATQQQQQELERNTIEDAELEKNYKYDLKPIFGYIAHMGCIKTLSANNRWLVSGSTDESIKYYYTIALCVFVQSY
jgi:hypothetical protein